MLAGASALASERLAGTTMNGDNVCDTCAQSLNDGDETCARCTLINLIKGRIWEAFEQAENCYVDREMDVIDTGGHYESFRMKPIAEYVLKTFEDDEFYDQVVAYMNGRWR